MTTNKEIYNLFKRSNEFQHITESYVDSISDYFIIRKNNRLIGIATFKDYKDCKRSWISEFEFKNTLCLCQFLVDQLEQSKGYGRILFDKVLSYAKEKGYDNVVLSVTPENKRAVKFYLKNDFKKYGTYEYDYVDLTLDIYKLSLKKDTVKEIVVKNDRPKKRQRV